jgi:hypothetical protein
MAYQITTALGRLVPYGDWATVRHDLVLKFLHDYHVSPFNKGDAPLARSDLARSTHLSEVDVADVIAYLKGRNLVTIEGSAPEPAYRITGDGVQFVQQLGYCAGAVP